MNELDVDALQRTLRRFADTRDWEQFHAPNNLAAALSVEAAELLEIFQWLDEAQSRAIGPGHPLHDHVAEEIADVQIYLLQLADKVGVDLAAAVRRKIARNEEKYPPEKVRGSAAKYDRS